MRQGMFTLSGAPSPTSHLDIIHLSLLDYYILSVFHYYIRSPLSNRILIFYLMRNLYLYNANIYSINNLDPWPLARKSGKSQSNNVLRKVKNCQSHREIREKSLSIIFDDKVRKIHEKLSKSWKTHGNEIVLQIF